MATVNDQLQALLQACKDLKADIKKKPDLLYGTVASVGATLGVIVGGASAANITPAAKGCDASVGDRVICSLIGTNITAIAVVGQNCPFPAGSYLFDDGSITPPAVWAGTTWERILDRFPLAAGNTYAAGSTGGEAQVTLTEATIPPHAHNDGTVPSVGLGGSGTASAATASDPWQGTRLTTSTGGGQPHNNMPPYLAIPLWHRLA